MRTTFGVLLAILALCVIVLFATPAHAVANVDQIAASSVRVIVGGGHGSGFVVGKNRVVTAAHVVENVTGDTVVVVFPGGRAGKGTVNRMAAADLAVIDVDTGDAPPVRLSCGVSPKPGTPITLYGNPLVARNIATFGYIAGKLIQGGPLDGYVPIDVRILPGNSGGAVFLDDGRVIGLSNAVTTLGALPVGTGLMTPLTTDLCYFINFDR